MSSNPINITYLLGIPPDDLTEIKSDIASLRAKLLSRLADLNTAQIRALLKYGSASTDFSGKTHAYADANPAMRPPFVNMDVYTQIVNDYLTLTDLMRDIAAISKQGSDTLKLLGSQKYALDLACYRGFQAAADMNVPGADLIVSDLAPRFAGQGKQVKATARKAAAAAKSEKPDTEA